VEGAGFKDGKVIKVVFKDKNDKVVLEVVATVANNQKLTTATFKLDTAGKYTYPYFPSSPIRILKSDHNGNSDFACFHRFILLERVRM
jgi:hypothetical protein